MRRLNKLFSAALALSLVAGVTLATNVTANAEEAEAPSLSVKTYVPDKYDAVDYYGGAGDIDPADGDGVTTFAHAGLVTPLEGLDVDFNTQFKLLSKNSVENGGDNVDGWVTYSFSAAPADISSDKTYPYYGGGGNGIFFHITNYSGSAAPNCVEVQVQQMVDGAPTAIVNSFFLDNALNTPVNFSLEQQDDATFTWTITRLSDNVVLKELTGLNIDSALFVNELGQTFVSTAVYEGGGCDGNHWEHRGVAWYSVQAYTYDITAEDVALSQESYEYEEGGTYTPDTTVTVNGTALTKDVDYMVEYENNTAVGTAKAKLTFFGVYGGNVVEKEFAITEKEVPTESASESEEPASASDAPATGDSASDGSVGDEPATSCFGSVGLGVVGVLLTLGGAVMFAKKRD